MKMLSALLAVSLVMPAVAGAAAMGNRATARIAETVRIHGLRVTPLRVLEDSRCPQMVTCVWAGRVRLAARVDGAMRELTLGQPIAVPHGQLRLAAVAPDRTTVGHRIPLAGYRFAFEFIPGSGLELIRR